MQSDADAERPIGTDMTEQARIRRLQDTLAIVGIGVIAFGAWSLAKMTLYFLMYDEAAQRQMFGISNEISMQAYYITFAVFALIDLAIRLYVGLSARSEGHGKRKGSAYLVIAAIMAATSVASVILLALGFSTSPWIIDVIMSVLIEATSAATLVLMIFCAARLRRLNRLSG